MTAISQSALLQALGWATLNSFWQVGVLWCLFALACRFGSVSPGRQFKLAVTGIGLGLLSFIFSLWFYLQPDTRQSLSPLLLNAESSPWLPIILTAASVTYLLLLVIPTAKLIQNWRFLRRLRRSSLHKAPYQYRLFVKKVSGHLGLRRPVQVFLSGLVSSPVTIGYVKPLILLPVASFNQLSIRQAEAILLHELAHIRRFDFVVNIAITIAQTLLYFNPFIRLFVHVAEASRERSCDNLVLQFDYDRVAYASALLQLEKTAQTDMSLAMAAAGKSPLLTRIQAILGVNKLRPALKVQHFTGLIASVLCVFALHSLFIAGKNSTEPDMLQAVTQFANPFHLAFTEDEPPVNTRSATTFTGAKEKAQTATTLPGTPMDPIDAEFVPEPPLPSVPAEPQFIQVANKEAAPALSPDEQQKVEEVINTTKKVLSAFEWQQLEQDIADGLTSEEKAQVRHQYEAEMERIDWHRMEQNMVQNFHHTDFTKVQEYLKVAQEQLQRDSLVNVYNKMLSQVEIVPKTHSVLPLPDLSIGEVETLKLEIRQIRDSLISTRNRPVIKL